MPTDIRRSLTDHYRRIREGDIEDDEGAACLYFDEDAGCMIHRWRPQTCRDFEIGGDDCLRLRQARIGSKPKPTLIGRTPDVLGGAMRILGTRISVELIRERVATEGIDGALSDYPHLSRPQIEAALAAVGESR